MPVATTIRTVLVPLDGSEIAERALPWAKAVVGDDAEIVLLEVIPVASSVRAFRGQVIGEAATIQEGYRQIAERQLNEAIARWFDKGDKVSTVIASGDPGEQILATAADKGAELIVMSSHGRGAIGRFVSGSVADRVVRHAPVPVMIVGPEGEIAKHAKIERIIAPVQDSDLSRAALPIAGAIGKLADAPVTVINVIVPPSDLMLTYPGMIPTAAFDETQDQMVADAREIVHQAVAALKAGGVEATGQIFSGNPADSIMGPLRTGDVIVLSSHARQGLARWVIGSTSMKLIRNGQAPVVVVTRESIDLPAESDS